MLSRARLSRSEPRSGRPATATASDPTGDREPISCDGKS